MKYILDGIQMKKIDSFSIEKMGIPSICLMERAALLVCNAIEDNFPKDITVLCVCGSGNNGADGLCVARILYNMGYKICYMDAMPQAKKTKEWLIEEQIVKNHGIRRVTDFTSCEYDVIVDGIFGIGLSRKITGDIALLVDQINNSKSKVIAIDIPSGVDSSKGLILGVAIRADITVTFGYLKVGLVMYPGADMAGKIIVGDCGFSKEAIKELDNIIYTYDEGDISRIPQRINSSNKGTYGKVLIIAGCETMAGAAYFSGCSAYRIGAGLVKLLTDVSNRDIIMKLLPEAVMSFYNDMELEELRQQIKASDVIVIGPGLSMSPKAKWLTYNTLEIAAKLDKAVIVDADALNIIADNGYHNMLKGCIITPHVGEMSRLVNKSISDIKKEIIDEAKTFSEKYNCICILKDAKSVVAYYDNIYINTTGNNGMSTAGCGDILTGIIAGIIAMGASKQEGAVLGTYIHGRCGDDACQRLGAYYMKATDIIESINNIIR